MHLSLSLFKLLVTNLFKGHNEITFREKQHKKRQDSVRFDIDRGVVK